MNIRYVKQTLLALIISTFAVAANAQNNAVSIDVLSWINGNFSFQYERSINDKLSFNIPLFLGIGKSIFKNDYEGTVIAAEAGLKYYVSGKATDNGFYVNPLFGFGVYLPKASGASSYAYVDYGFNVGYALNLYKGLWMDSFLGYSNTAAPLSESAAKVSYFNAGWGAGMMFGYNW